MDFLFGLDMLRKHQCIIDLKENVLRVGGGEVSVPFLQEKDIPTNFLDEVAKQASSSGAQATSGTRENSRTQTEGSAPNRSQGPEFEAKVTRLIELGFGREAVVQALKFFDGNEDQAAGYLFGA
ncbi:protein DNA-DAMAGE INDUCIBLE 1-like [Camellia sinensis]|nr:protein DNA-DAMAGE INDUCIBLE 1-like [Camellia sinensis]